MSFGMFCSIPQPFHLWDVKAANLVLPCLPLIGILIGALWWGVASILVFSGIPIILISAVVMLAPFLASGFLHLDGYMDTSDAVLSRSSYENKLRILKDPNTGAFAVIMLAVLFILQFAVVFTLIEQEKNLLLLFIIPIISRCCSALSVLCLKPITQSGYASLFRQDTETAHKIFVIFIAILAIGFSYFFTGIHGLIVAVLSVAGSVAALAWAYRDLKGISGDLAGFAIVISEFCGLAAIALPIVELG
jgi:adenosylcobinamide-GDP ribazoletransferase